MVVKLEEIKPDDRLSGVLPEQVVTVIAVKQAGTHAFELTYKMSSGDLRQGLVFRTQEPELAVVGESQRWKFDADGTAFKLAAEAHRIRLAHLFDPMLAVHTSLVDPLPHQITAVYSEMLTRQPLRFLLADDPGAGKTIMAGLLIKELKARGDLQRCLIVCPGSLVEQWQDELATKFHLPFEIMTNDGIEASRTGNWLEEHPMVIARLDMLSRNEDLHPKLDSTEWDLVVCDEAHKMSATYAGTDVRRTKRFQLGEKLSKISRHFLLMTATPHNGKEEDFHLFLSLIDEDRFEGKFRPDHHSADVSDIMRRMLKEQLVKFDGRPLFPERRAYTVNYSLSDTEDSLYRKVTEYVRTEWTRADQIRGDNRVGTVGFALTTLQRRLASSPEAIFQSLRRRRERLEERLKEEEAKRTSTTLVLQAGELLSAEELEDLDDAPESEVERLEDQITDRATAAQTLAELKTEIATLKELEAEAAVVRTKDQDRKWAELRQLLQDEALLRDSVGSLRKLVIFTEHRDTLNYLARKISGVLGRENGIVMIHGGMRRDERKTSENAFRNDKEVAVLIATDAAGEGINLQRAHLMVNYDLPWNPNRLEQRFGRIHRIGQTEVCHLWNLVARDTREGDVYRTLLEKLEEENEALGGQVFDVLGKITFDNRPLRELLIEAVRYGDSPTTRQRLERVMESSLNREHLKSLLQDNALGHEVFDGVTVQRVRDAMERAEARKLQPHFIGSFFLSALRGLGGHIHEREPSRYEITHVSADVRENGRNLGRGEPVLRKYERVTFDKNHREVAGKPLAEFVCPGHPLLDATINVVLAKYGGLLESGTILVDRNSRDTEPRVLFFVEHAVHDATQNSQGQHSVIAQQVQFVELKPNGHASAVGFAPYLDYDTLSGSELEAARQTLNQPWLTQDLSKQVRDFVAGTVAPKYFVEQKVRREQQVARTRDAVNDRLVKEIAFWDSRAATLRDSEAAGKKKKHTSGRAQARADELTQRLAVRQAELAKEGHLSASPPRVLGGALVIPQGLLDQLMGRDDLLSDRETVRIELLAMAAVMDHQRSIGNEPRDVSAEKCGYDIESRDQRSGQLQFIEVKGRAKGAKTISVTRNEILTALNKPDGFWLAIVEVDGDVVDAPCYIARPFRTEPDLAATSVTYNLSDLRKQ